MNCVKWNNVKWGLPVQPKINIHNLENQTWWPWTNCFAKTNFENIYKLCIKYILKKIIPWHSYAEYFENNYRIVSYIRWIHLMMHFDRIFWRFFFVVFSSDSQHTLFRTSKKKAGWASANGSITTNPTNQKEAFAQSTNWKAPMVSL